MNYLEINSFSLDDIAKTCRLCLSGNCKLYQIFSSNETDALGVSLSMRVILCTNVAISKHDKLPQKICQNCLNYINDWYLFRKKCKLINHQLKQKISAEINKDSNQDITNENSIKNTNDNLMERLSITQNQEFVMTSKLFCFNEDVNMNCDQADGLNKSTNVKNIDTNNHEPYEKKKKFECSVCPDSFYHLKDLKLHKTVIHNFTNGKIQEKVPLGAENDVKLEGIKMRTRYEMKCCNKVFFNKAKFRRHYNEKHPGEKPFMCETCGKKDFISEETLKRHKVLHTGKFRCEICSKTFTCNAILILHKKDKHENDKPFICDVCGKRFVTELLMNYHKRFHTGEKKYICEECGLAVVTSSSLAKHKRIHSKEKPHVCHICGKGFIIKGRLVEHLRVHTGERPFSCQICRKGFTMRDKLKRHMQVHSGEKHYSCEYCGNNYSTRYSLSVHLKTHITKDS